MRFTKLIFAVLILAQSLGIIQAQVSCGGQQLGEGCIKYPAETYQCIEGDFPASALYGTKLLPPAQAQNTAQFIIVKGKITFFEEYTFAPGSDIVFLDNNSGFKVSNTKKLTLSSSWLHGCTKLWAGVEVMNSAKIVAQNCTFEDAKAAIILRNQSVAEITGNTFKKNVCCILGLSSNPGAQISILLGSRKGISGNTFWGNHQLLEPIVPATIDAGINSDASSGTTNYPYTGIWIERVNSLSIGILSNQAGVPLNSFLNFGKNKELNVKTHGIRAFQSNMSVQNSTFSNFGNYDPNNVINNIEADAIFANNDVTALMQTTVTGTNLTAPISPSNTFSNCFQDIRALGTHLTVTDMTSYKAGNSIRANAANSQQGAPILKVKNNKIDYFIGEAIYMGIRKPATIDIQNNQIFDNNEAIGPFFRFGIVIDNTGNAEIHLKGSLIKNNEIRSRSILQGGYFVGIVLRKSSYLTIEQNQVLEVLPQSNLGVFHGILTNEFPCNGLRLYSNTINGATINYVGPSAGIYIRESVNCIVNCNQTDNVNIGALFLGMCDNADVSKNRFNYHGIGLGLGAPQLPTTTSIGPQSKKENRWFGTNSPIEAYALNPATAMDSKFEINSSDLNSDYWPLPRKIGSTNDNFVWFTQLIGQEPSNNFTCFTGKTFGEGVLAGSDIRLLNGNYSSPLNYPALTWEAKWQFADRLNRNPSLQTINGMAAQYYQNTYNDNYSRLNRAYQSYINRWQPDATIESQTASLVTAIEQRFALDFTLSLNFDDNSALHSQMLTSDADITDKTASLKSTFENWIPTVNQSVNTLIAEVNSVTCAQEYESDMKSLLIVMLQSHFTGGELSAQQTATISQIANKCRYSAGYAVVLARGFFEQQESYAQDEYCQTGERSDIPTANISDAVTLYPNPASQSFLLGMGLPAVQGQLQMFNSQGKMVRSIGLSDAATFVSVSDLPEGVYYINIRLDSSETAHKIFVKIK